MNISEGAAIGIGSGFITWVGSALLAGRKVGQAEGKITALAKEVTEHKEALEKLRVESAEYLQKVRVELSQDIARLQVHHDQDMQRLNGQKWITVPEHEGMCERNNKLVVKAVEQLTLAMEKNTEVVAKMGDKIHILDVDVAVLKERRESGQRQANSHEGI